jgi:hypothetical protein|uniref:Uncharacterized protein n=1 Tax=Zea mays TaxID=4577 RepID=B4FKJ6_MAIZE|nr:unknown [Zea mays]
MELERVKTSLPRGLKSPGVVICTEGYFENLKSPSGLEGIEVEMN